MKQKKNNFFYLKVADFLRSTNFSSVSLTEEKKKVYLSEKYSAMQNFFYSFHFLLSLCFFSPASEERKERKERKERRHNSGNGEKGRYLSSSSSFSVLYLFPLQSDPLKWELDQEKFRL